MRDIIRDVISYSARSCDMDKICVNEKNKKKTWKSKGVIGENLNINFYLKDDLGVDFTAC